MGRTLQCRDAGFDCEAVVRGENDDEIVDQAVQHAKEVHDVDADAGMREQLRSLIRTG